PAASTGPAPPATTGAAEMGFDAVERALGATDLHVIATFPLRMMESLHGYLLILSPDRLALARRAPLTNLLLQTTADLMAGALANQRFGATLEDTNRALGALSQISSAVLRPGATRQQVLEATVQHLTDAQVPEFDFQFATAYLLDDPDGALGVGTDARSSLAVRLA